MALIDTLFRAELPTVEVLLNSHPDFFDEAIAPSGAAEFLGSTVAALAQMRTRGGGPKYIRIAPPPHRQTWLCARPYPVSMRRISQAAGAPRRHDPRHARGSRRSRRPGISPSSQRGRRVGKMGETKRESAFAVPSVTVIKVTGLLIIWPRLASGRAFVFSARAASVSRAGR